MYASDRAPDLIVRCCGLNYNVHRDVVTSALRFLNVGLASGMQVSDANRPALPQSPTAMDLLSSASMAANPAHTGSILPHCNLNEDDPQLIDAMMQYLYCVI